MRKGGKRRFSPIFTSITRLCLSLFRCWSTLLVTRSPAALCVSLLTGCSRLVTARFQLLWSFFFWCDYVIKLMLMHDINYYCATTESRQSAPYLVATQLLSRSSVCCLVRTKAIKRQRQLPPLTRYTNSFYHRTQLTHSTFFSPSPIPCWQDIFTIFISHFNPFHLHVHCVRAHDESNCIWNELTAVKIAIVKTAHTKQWIWALAGDQMKIIIILTFQIIDTLFIYRERKKFCKIN